MKTAALILGIIGGLLGLLGGGFALALGGVGSVVGADDASLILGGGAVALVVSLNRHCRRCAGAG